MPRVKGGVVTKNRHKKWLKMAKGYKGKRSTSFKIAKLAVIHALQYAYRDRKNVKREMRGLWNSRIGIASKLLGTSYSRLIHGLKVNNVELDRKILSSIATDDANTFEKIAEISKNVS